jgi:hypothetical protein
VQFFPNQLQVAHLASYALRLENKKGRAMLTLPRVVAVGEGILTHLHSLILNYLSASMAR